MSNVPTPSGGSSPVAGERSPAKRSPGQVDYVDAERIGFERVPEVLVDEMRAMGLLAGEMWVASADEGVAKRRPDGTHYQRINGFWASPWRYLEIDARRELKVEGDGRLRPSGPWSASGTIWDFPGAFGPTRSVWRYQPEPVVPGGRRPVRRKAKDPLEALPGSVAGPVIGGTSEAWREYGRGWASETIVGSRVVGGRVLLLRANREASSKTALEKAVNRPGFRDCSDYWVTASWAGAS